MMTLAACGTKDNNRFDVVAEAFLQKGGLPFADVLTSEAIQRVFREEHALFGQDDLFSTDIVLWAFLAQTLRDGKGAACAAAVADIATYMIQTGQRPPCGDTGDYCRARAKLSLPALRRLVVESAQHVEREADASWLWKGLHPKLVDGFTFTMPDTPENQEAFPQSPTQTRGVGLPIARCVAVLSLASACVCDLAVGPYEGKQTGEPALLRDLLKAFDENDVVVFDRCYCSYTVIATAAAVHGQQPRHVGFTLACQTILVSWMLLSTGSCSNPRAMYTTMLAHIAANKVANRPGRIEPRVLKRRRHRYPLIQRPRAELRAKLRKT